MRSASGRLITDDNYERNEPHARVAYAKGPYVISLSAIDTNRRLFLGMRRPVRMNPPFRPDKGPLSRGYRGLGHVPLRDTAPQTRYSIFHIPYSIFHANQETIEFCGQPERNVLCTSSSYNTNPRKHFSAGLTFRDRCGD